MFPPRSFCLGAYKTIAFCPPFLNNLSTTFPATFPPSSLTASRRARRYLRAAFTQISFHLQEESMTNKERKQIIFDSTWGTPELRWQKIQEALPSLQRDLERLQHDGATLGRISGRNFCGDGEGLQEPPKTGHANCDQITALWELPWDAPRYSG